MSISALLGNYYNWLTQPIREAISTEDHAFLFGARIATVGMVLGATLPNKNLIQGIFTGLLLGISAGSFLAVKRNIGSDQSQSIKNPTYTNGPQTSPYLKYQSSVPAKNASKIAICSGLPLAILANLYFKDPMLATTAGMLTAACTSTLFRNWKIQTPKTGTVYPDPLPSCNPDYVSRAATPPQLPLPFRCFVAQFSTGDFSVRCSQVIGIYDQRSGHLF